MIGDVDAGPAVEAPGIPASGLAGLVRTVPVLATGADVQIISVASALMGWSLRESTGLAGAIVEFFSGTSQTGELLATVALTAGFDPTASQTPASNTASGGNAVETASIVAGAGLFAFITSLRITGLGATAATTVTATLTGVQGGTINYPVAVPAGVTTPITPVTDSFGTRGQQSAAAGGTISLALPAFGAGNTLESASITGYVQATAGSEKTQSTPGRGLQAPGGIFLHVVQGSVRGAVWVAV